MNNNYELVLLTEKYFKELYNWQTAEKHFDYYTCRPVNLINSYNKYENKLKESIHHKKTYILISKEIML